MKKNTLACIGLAAAAIVILCVLAAYLTWQYGDEAFPAQNSKTESEADAVIGALSEAASGERAETAAADGQADGTDAGSQAGQEDTAERSAQENSSGPFAIWVGDSRTLGMKEALNNADLYIGAAGEGYTWFAETGLEEMKKAVQTYPDCPVVLNFGVNDYDNMDRYMELYQSLTEEYPDTHFYFLSVNPIDPEVCHNITNEEIADFNNHLRSLFPDTYLDSYTEIKAHEIIPFDGIHYTKDDYRLIYDYAAGEIAKKEAL